MVYSLVRNMEWHIMGTAQLVQAGRQAYKRKWPFLGVFILVFAGNVGILEKSGLLPDAPRTEVSAVAGIVAAVASVPTVVVEEPLKIEIPKISLAAVVANPTTTNIEALDKHLLAGAVRYPTSAKLGEKGNVVLFGHSSYLPIVGNQAYRTFNGIQKLIAGDMITVSSASRVYTYRVRTMTKESADDAGIPLSVEGRVLTLATCDSFGKKTDRFVVVADFVESQVIPL